MAMYPNGQIPTGALIPLSTGGTLIAPVAAAFEELKIRAARAGFVIALTSVGDAYRSLERQIKVFRERYAILPFPEMGPYGDVRPWDSNGNGVKERWVRVSGASAAIPGTSNHGWGRAVDISSTGGFGGRLYAWLAANAPALGWSNTEGRSVNESWHWVHTGAWVVSNPIGSGGAVTTPTLPGTPAPLNPEDDMPDLSEIEAMTRGVVREQILQVLRAPEFALTEADRRRQTAEAVLGGTVTDGRTYGTQHLSMVLGDIFAHARAAAATDAIVTAVVAALAPLINSADEVDEALVRTLVRDGVRDAITSIETTVTINTMED